MGYYPEADIPQVAKEARLKVLDLIHKAQTSHIGSNLSVIDIFATLFARIDFDGGLKDKLILSKGWAAATLYYFLWKIGRLTTKQLDSFCLPGSKFIGLAEPVHKDIPFAGGSMGMGLAAGVALAWDKLQRNLPGQVYVIESDGGMQEGSTWEAMMFAAHHKLENLTLLIDANGFQAMGRTDRIVDSEENSLLFKCIAFGWATLAAQGHDYGDLNQALAAENTESRPKAIICHTVKGKGVSFMENNNDFHYLKVTDAFYDEAKREIEAG